MARPACHSLEMPLETPNAKSVSALYSGPRSLRSFGVGAVLWFRVPRVQWNLVLAFGGRLDGTRP